MQLHLIIIVALDLILGEAMSWFLGQALNIKAWKRIVLPLILALAGAGGVKLMYFVENGNFTGLSFFGFIFFSPLIMISIAPIMKIKIGNMLDMIAPLECMALGLHKISCFITGCCEGMALWITDAGEIVRFPSQIVECANGLLISALLFYYVMKGKHRNKIFFIYMVIYGITRYGLNWLRNAEPSVWFIPAGNLWAILCFVIGAVVLLIMKKKEKSAISKNS